MNTFKRIAATVMAFIFINSAFAYTKQNLLNAIKADSTSQVKKILTISPNLSTLKYDSDGNSSLMFALQNKCNNKIIDMLLDAGCSPDLKNKAGQTAVMFACNYGYNGKIVKKIINYNVLTKSGRIRRILYKDSKNKCAFDYAKENTQAYDALLEYTLDPATIKDEPIASDDTETVEEEAPEPEDTEEDEIQEEIEEEDSVETEEPAIQEDIDSEETALAQDEISEINQDDTEDISQEISPEEVPVEKTASVEEVTAAETTEEPSAVQNVAETESAEITASVEQVEITAVTEDETVESDTTVTDDTSSEKSATAETTETKEISNTVEVPAIDYYNSKRPEYLFDEITTEIEVEETTLDQIKETKVHVISNPDSVDNVGRTRLMNAIMASDEKLCYALLYSGADANARDKDGWTPLMYACRYAKSQAIIQLLFEYHAKLDAKSNYKVSVLQIAAAHCENKTILNGVLAEAEKQKLNIQESFISALKEERPEGIIQEYFKFKVNVNSLYKGKTPLMYAAENYESTEVIKLLLDKGADPYVISAENKNAFSYAKENSKIVHDSVYWSLNVSSSKKR